MLDIADIMATHFRNYLLHALQGNGRGRCRANIFLYTHCCSVHSPSVAPTDSRAVSTAIFQSPLCVLGGAGVLDLNASPNKANVGISQCTVRGTLHGMSAMRTASAHNPRALVADAMTTDNVFLDARTKDAQQ